MVKVLGVDVKFWTFPGGERNVRIDYLKELLEDVSNNRPIVVSCMFKSSDDILDLALVVDAIRRIVPHAYPIHLNIPYFPAARQDRVMVEGEALGVRVYTQIINSLGFSTITIDDPHSDVLVGLFPANVIHVNDQASLMTPWANRLLYAKRSFALVSPDAGASKKIYNLAKSIQRMYFLDSPVDVIEAVKRRDVSTGKITSSAIPSFDVTRFDTLVVADDIVDGGASFIGLAENIRQAGFTGKLELWVSHGIFSKGLACLEACFDEILVINDLSSVSSVSV